MTCRRQPYCDCWEKCGPPRHWAHPLGDGNARFSNNPGVYDFQAQVKAWPYAWKSYVGREPDQNAIDRSRMARENGQLDWGTFFAPIPDPMQVARPVFFSENPITSGLRNPIVDMRFNSGPAVCRGAGVY